VALPDGLITPVVRDCGRKGIVAIDTELADLVDSARAGKLAPEEYSGATFTISNLGASGIEEFTAIINPPGSAILAVGAVRKEVVVEAGDAIVVRQRMRLTLSCDHRVIDGVVGAAFLRELADMLEDPMLALA
jgi:pyruvate dehydrogenase E2 component (dihydrolipoamide acetyltransferase)